LISVSAKTRARRYRCAAIGMLLAGFIGAGLIYWLGWRAADRADDPSMLGFNRAEERQMGILYGKQGRLFEDLTNALKQPGTQAILLLLAGAISAAGCFYYARIVEDESAPTATGNGKQK
jgi:hypothetical protein